MELSEKIFFHNIPSTVTKFTKLSSIHSSLEQYINSSTHLSSSQRTIYSLVYASLHTHTHHFYQTVVIRISDSAAIKLISGHASAEVSYFIRSHVFNYGHAPLSFHPLSPRHNSRAGSGSCLTVKTANNSRENLQVYLPRREWNFRDSVFAPPPPRIKGNPRVGPSQ